MVKKKEHDFSLITFRIVQEATGEVEPTTKKKAFDVRAPGRLGGLKGSIARAARLTPERRAQTAKKAALARWKK